MKKLLMKKGLILSLLLVLVAGAVFVNWKYGGSNVKPDSTTKPGEVAAVTTSSVQTKKLTEQQQSLLNAKKERDKTTSDTIAELKEIEGNTSLEEDARKLATKQRAELYQNAVLESTIEEMVIAKGYSECAVVINKDNITVIVIKDKLENSDTMQILDIVKSQSDYQTEKIKIMNI